MNFIDAFSRLIGHEGGLSMAREDRGNWTGGKVGVGELRGTKYGISAAAYPHLDIKALTLDDAKKLYLRDYWGPVGCDALPDRLKFAVFDLAVNSGPGRAARILQRAVGAHEDGAIGPKTLLAVMNMHPERILRRMDAYRMQLMTEDPTWPAHGRGWIRRIAENILEAP